MLARLQEFVAELDLPIGGTLRVLFRHGGLGAHDSTQAFVFRPGVSAPCCVIKIATTKGRDTLRAERDRLLWCRRSISTVRADSIPAVLGYREEVDGAMLAETYLPGRRLKDVALGSEHGARVIRHLVDWLIDLNRSTPPMPGSAAGTEVGLVVAEPVAQYIDRFETSAANRELLAELPERIRSLLGEPLPVVAAHGDLSDANILIDRDRLAIVDWGEQCDLWLPGFDLAHLLCSLAASRHGLGRRATFERAFVDSFLRRTDASLGYREAWRRYIAAMALPHDAGYWLFLLAWIRFSLHKLHYLNHATELTREAFFADPQTEFPVTFFAAGRCLNVDLLLKHRETFAL